MKASGLATSDILMIDFFDIPDDGRTETASLGGLWSPAPPWRGQAARWVRPVADGIFQNKIILVVTVTRRHRCAIMGRYGRAVLKAGRWIDPGENYSDAATREWTDRTLNTYRTLLGRKAIPGGTLDPQEYAMLSGGTYREMMST